MATPGKCLAIEYVKRFRETIMINQPDDNVDTVVFNEGSLFPNLLCHILPVSWRPAAGAPPTTLNPFTSLARKSSCNKI